MKVIPNCATFPTSGLLLRAFCYFSRFCVIECETILKLVINIIYMRNKKLLFNWNISDNSPKPISKNAIIDGDSK